MTHSLFILAMLFSINCYGQTIKDYRNPNTKLSQPETIVILNDSIICYIDDKRYRQAKKKPHVFKIITDKSSNTGIKKILVIKCKE